MATFYRAVQPSVAALRPVAAYFHPLAAPAFLSAHLALAAAAPVAQVEHRSYQWQGYPVWPPTNSLAYSVYPTTDQHWPVDQHCVRSPEEQNPAAPGAKARIPPREQVQPPATTVNVPVLEGVCFNWRAVPVQQQTRWWRG